MKWIRRAVYLVAGLGVLLAALVFYAQNEAVERAQRKMQISVRPVAFAQDDSAHARGRYLYESRGCADCHGLDGAGRTLVEDGKGTHLAGPNITRGNPGIAAYTEVDWVRTLRHGLARDGRVLRVMPSEDYNQLTDVDLAALVSWVRQFEPRQGNEQPILKFPLPAVIAYGLGAVPDAADRIDHARPAPLPVPEAVSVEHGRYVAAMCIGCHGAGYQGGRIPGGPPDWPAASRLAPGEGSVLPRYADAEVFVSMMKSGKRPDGSRIGVMPFEALGRMSDTDLRALHLFLKNLPAS